MTLFTIIAIALSICGATLTAIKELRTSYGSQVEDFGKLLRANVGWYTSITKEGASCASMHKKLHRCTKNLRVWRFSIILPLVVFAAFTIFASFQVLGKLNELCHIDDTHPSEVERAAKVVAMFTVTGTAADVYWWWVFILGSVSLLTLAWTAWAGNRVRTLANSVEEVCVGAREMNSQAPPNIRPE